MEEIIRSSGRTPRQRTTSYGEVNTAQYQKSFGANELKDPEYTSAKGYERKKSGTEKKALYRPGLEVDGEERLNSADII